MKKSKEFSSSEFVKKQDKKTSEQRIREMQDSIDKLSREDKERDIGKEKMKSEEENKEEEVFDTDVMQELRKKFGDNYTNLLEKIYNEKVELGNITLYASAEYFGGRAIMSTGDAIIKHLIGDDGAALNILKNIDYGFSSVLKYIITRDKSLIDEIIKNYLKEDRSKHRYSRPRDLVNILIKFGQIEQAQGILKEAGSISEEVDMNAMLYKATNENYYKIWALKNLKIPDDSYYMTSVIIQIWLGNKEAAKLELEKHDDDDVDKAKFLIYLGYYDEAKEIINRKNIGLNQKAKLYYLMDDSKSLQDMLKSVDDEESKLIILALLGDKEKIKEIINKSQQAKQGRSMERLWVMCLLQVGDLEGAIEVCNNMENEGGRDYLKGHILREFSRYYEYCLFGNYHSPLEIIKKEKKILPSF